MSRSTTARRDRTTAWGLPSEWSSRSSPGDVVRVGVRRWSRRVVALTVLQEGGGRTLHRGFDTSDNTDNLVLEAMGERRNSIPVAVRNQPATAVLTAEEVARAVGAPVKVREIGPINGLYETMDGKPVAMIQMQRGPIAKVWWAAAKRGTPLAGIGDEAYMTDVGRRHPQGRRGRDAGPAPHGPRRRTPPTVAPGPGRHPPLTHRWPGLHAGNSPSPGARSLGRAALERAALERAASGG